MDSDETCEVRTGVGDQFQPAVPRTPTPTPTVTGAGSTGVEVPEPPFLELLTAVMPRDAYGSDSDSGTLGVKSAILSYRFEQVLVMEAVRQNASRWVLDLFGKT